MFKERAGIVIADIQKIENAAKKNGLIVKGVDVTNREQFHILTLNFHPTGHFGQHDSGLLSKFGKVLGRDRNVKSVSISSQYGHLELKMDKITKKQGHVVNRSLSGSKTERGTNKKESEEHEGEYQASVEILKVAKMLNSGDRVFGEILARFEHNKPVKGLVAIHHIEDALQSLGFLKNYFDMQIRYMKGTPNESRAIGVRDNVNDAVDDLNDALKVWKRVDL